jgi:transmembrane sensor
MKNDDLIQKWLKDELNDSEKQAFNELHDAEFNAYIVDNAKYFKASDISQIDDFNKFKNKYNSQKTPVKKLNWLNPLLKIASVLVVSLALYFTFFNSSETFVETLASEKTRVELPDQSIVELNALSSIAYQTKSWDENRALKLNGEAYFKVAKGKTFDVITKQGIVTVVGTQFNVKERDNYFEVVCFEGIVKVASNAITRQLLAGDTFKIINGTFTEGKTKSDTPKWTDNMSDFEAVPFAEVLAEFERQYNTEISTKDIDTNRLFTGSFPHNNLKNALIAITQPMQMTFEISPTNSIVIHGQKK